MRWSTGLLVAASIGVALAASSAAWAQEGQAIETFVCESVDNSHRECPYRSTGQVTVHVNKQLSRTRCVFDENWARSTAACEWITRAGPSSWCAGRRGRPPTARSAERSRR